LTAAEEAGGEAAAAGGRELEVKLVRLDLGLLTCHFPIFEG
jgi:hypothetical protein